jgi:hypothetical protein
VVLLLASSDMPHTHDPGVVVVTTIVASVVCVEFARVAVAAVD